MCATLLTALAAVALVTGYSDRQHLTGDDVALATDQEVHELTGFTSRSGNIGCYIDPLVGCYIDPLYVRCDIRERNWAPPPKPTDCPDYTDFGQGIKLGTGSDANFVCAGDTALSSGAPLAYGDTITAGQLQCDSMTSGMQCWDFAYGSGFTLSRDGYELF